MPKKKPNAGNKTVGSAYQKCPLKGKKQAAIQVLVVDPKKTPIFGMKVAGVDKTPTKNEAPTDDSGLVTLKPFIPGPLDLELTFDDNEKKIYLAPHKAMGVAKAGKDAGYHLFVLKPLIKRISPKIVYDDDRLEVNPKAKTSAALGVTLSMTQSHPEVDLDVDGELTRSGAEIELYTDQGLTAAVTFTGDKATIPSADIKQPKKYWIKGTALTRATLALKGVPLNAGKLNLDLEHEYTEGVTLFAPDATPKIVKIDPTFMPGKDRKIKIGCHLSDVHAMAADGYIEIADKDGTVAWTSPKKTFPRDKTDNNDYEFEWDGKGTDGSIVPNDKGPYKVRFIVTDKYDRKPQDETEIGRASCRERV